MILNDSSKVIDFTPQQLPEDELDSLCIPNRFKRIRPYIVKIDGKYYFYKNVNEEAMINELIGSYLSKIIGLDAVDYIIGLCDGKLVAVSEVFYRNGYRYEIPREYYGYYPDNIVTKLKWYVFDTLPRFLDTPGERIQRFFPDMYFQEASLLKKVDNPCVLESVMKMTALDLKMGQSDRAYHSNMLLRVSDDTVEVEKIYDFERSYSRNFYYPHFKYYENPFLTVRKNALSIIGLTRKYRQLSSCAAILSDIPVYDVIREIEKDNNIEIRDELIPSYLTFDKEANKLLRKIR